MTIRLLDHFAQYALEAHVCRHHLEDDDEHFMSPQSTETVLAQYQPVLWRGEPETDGGSWQKVWGWYDGLDMRAHAVLTGNEHVPYRCTLGLGVERSWRRRGIGRQLMRTAISWARENQAIEWLDGYALADNAPVLALDFAEGFVECGRIPDVARFDGHSVAQLVLCMGVK